MIPLQDHNSHDGPSPVTITLIVINVIVFFFEPLGSLEEWIPYADRWAIIPAQLVAEPALEFYTIVTAMFLHGSLMHLGGNMLYLWIFGDNIEHILGPIRYLMFYLVAGLVATLAQVYIDPTSTIPNVGASGAIAGVLGGYFLLFPSARVTTLIPILLFRRIRLPALAVLGFWFLMQLWSGYQELGMVGQGGVAFWAHIGGFVAGVLTVKLFGDTRRVNNAQLDYIHFEESQLR